MLILRILLLPFTILYGIAIFLRNLLYSAGILNRTSFDIPIICVGNLSAGGTGKTPHIEYLIRLLGNQYKMAVLSRGYMRKTSGYVFAGADATPQTIGDEPFQIYKKFPSVAVGVCENRVLGVPDLLADAPETQVVLMDDGFQHLPIRAGFNIILTAYNNLFTRDWLLPSGRLREFRSAYKRADIIIVTKCPADLSKQEQQKITAEINPLPHQQVFFSRVQYDPALRHVFGNNDLAPGQYKGKSVIGFSGIADAEGFEAAARGFAETATFQRYSDHHSYTEGDLKEIVQRYESGDSTNRIIVTTEKDAVKLAGYAQLIAHLPVYYLSMAVQLDGDGENLLVESINTYITSA